MRHPLFMTITPALIALYLPFCATEVRPTFHPPDSPAASLWQEPHDLAERDLFYGPWGPERAPDPDGLFTLIERKHSGVNPGMTVRDADGRQWSVKQAPADGWASEAPVEVTLSRVLSAAGYHQPPVFFLPSFRLADDWGVELVPGGRFRLKDKRLKDVGTWSWQQNPFVGTRPYQGLLVILLLFNSSDLKNSNTTLYEYRGGEQIERRFVVRDLGSALGTTGRIAPRKNDVAAFERARFITGIRDGFVEFAYAGFHQELVRGRITPDDVRWACDLLGRMSEQQWHDAFRAGGFEPAVAARYITTLRARIAEGRRTAGPAGHQTSGGE